MAGIAFCALAQTDQSDELGQQVARTVTPWMDALDRCGELEYKDIESCASNKSPLIEDKEVAQRAKRALELRSDFYAYCQKTNPKQYCDDLFYRAIKHHLMRKAGLIKKR